MTPTPNPTVTVYVREAASEPAIWDGFAGAALGAVAAAAVAVLILFWQRAGDRRTFEEQREQDQNIARLQRENDREVAREDRAVLAAQEVNKMLDDLVRATKRLREDLASNRGRDAVRYMFDDVASSIPQITTAVLPISDRNARVAIQERVVDLQSTLKSRGEPMVELANTSSGSPFGRPEWVKRCAEAHDAVDEWLKDFKELIAIPAKYIEDIQDPSVKGLPGASAQISQTQVRPDQHAQ